MLIGWKGTLLCTLGNLALKSSEQYRYTALDTSKKEIRLLSIDAVLQNTYVVDSSATPSKTAHIICASLDNVPIDEAGSYTALSYTWGTSEPTHRISIGNKVLDIRENLYEALIHLHKASVTRVWIDAICINQEDDREKGLQVQRMGDIYREADKVIAWLGIHDDESVALFKWINIARRDGIVLNDTTQIPPRLDAALNDLANRPYFTRMWVVQEFALGRKVGLMCGDDFVDPDPLSELFYRYACTEKAGRFAPAASLVMLKQVRDIQRQGVRHGLIDLIIYVNSVYIQDNRNAMHAFHSSDMLDQVYGLLGLVYDSHQFVPEPNYSKSFTMNNLFEYMTKSIIKNTKRLDYVLLEAGDSILNSTDFGARNAREYIPARLPSWCPDYVNLVESPLNAEVTGAVDFSSTPSEGLPLFRHRYGVRRPCWHATQSSELTNTDLWKEDSTQMHVSGMLIGKILACSSSGDKIDPVAVSLAEVDDNPTLLGLVQLLYTYSEVTVPSPSDAIIALFLALQLDLGVLSFLDISRIFFQKRLNESKIRDEFSWLFKWAVRREYVERLTTLSPAEWERMCQLSRNLTASTNKNYDDFRRQVGAFTPNISAKTVVDVVARYGAFAWIPSIAEPGDEIWLVKGCSMPVVLRRLLSSSASNPKIFVKVGPAVVNGAMSGDMWSEDDLSSIAIV